MSLQIFLYFYKPNKLKNILVHINDFRRKVKLLDLNSEELFRDYTSCSCRG